MIKTLQMGLMILVLTPIVISLIMMIVLAIVATSVF